jgi:hypothetical protein
MIIHAVIVKGYSETKKQKIHYLCNQATDITFNKMSWYINKQVTCKNCLKRMDW